MATQTQQPSSIANPSIAQTHGFQNQQSIDTTVVPPIKTSEQRTIKKGSDKSRKDKNRYSSMRAAPAGQQQPGKQ